MLSHNYMYLGYFRDYSVSLRPSSKFLEWINMSLIKSPYETILLFYPSESLSPHHIYDIYLLSHHFWTFLCFPLWTNFNIVLFILILLKFIFRIICSNNRKLRILTQFIWLFHRYKALLMSPDFCIVKLFLHLIAEYAAE